MKITSEMFKKIPPPQDQIQSPSPTEDIPPKNVSKKAWEKFKLLEKRTDDVTRRSTEKRIKHLQKEVIEKVQSEIRLPEDQDILREHDVKFTPHQSTDEIGKNKKNNCRKRPAEDCGQTTAGVSGCNWQDLKPYLNAHEHLKDVEHGDLGPKSKLEKSIEVAIEKGNFDEAEHLSDHLSNREFGAKIANAFDAVEFMKKKKKEEETEAAKRRKTLHWGFQQKHRWETKSNM